jgi:hypothetical protein
VGTATHVYSLRISLAGCRYDVRINDVPIFRDMGDGLPMTAAMAINEYLTDGPNALSVSLLPATGRDTLEPPADSFLVGLLGRPADAPKTADLRLVTLHLRPGANPQQLVRVEGTGLGLLTLGSELRIEGDGRAGLDASGGFQLTGSNHHWAWQDSEAIDDSPRTRDALRAVFTGWIMQLRARDTSWLPPSLAERNRELSKALFEPIAALEAHGLLEAAADPELTLFDPDLAESELRVFGQGRLARLVRWDETPIIVYVEPDGQSARYFPFTFRRGRSGWIVCR